MPTPFMNRPVLSLAVVAVLGSTAAAQAPGIDPEDAIAPIAVVEGAGVKVGDGTVLHPSIGLEAGVVTNVFYTDQNTVAAGVVRLIGEVGAGSLSPQRLAPTEQTSMDISQPTSAGDFQYRTDLRLSYEYLPSTDDQVSSQGGLGAGFNFRGIINPQRSRQFAVVEDYQRLIRPTNFDSSGNTNRDINDLKLQFQYAPLGRNLSGIIHYEDIVDVFEANTQQFANRFQNTIGLRINYQWLPQTRVYVDATEGIDTGLGDSEKVTSYPLLTVLGLQTLLSPAVAVTGRVGYTNGFYSEGPSYSSIVGGLSAAYWYSPISHLAVLYQYLHNDSINANFYRDHQIQASLEHAFTPFDVIVQGTLSFREYQGLIISTGPQVRDDTLGSILGEVRYNFRDWIAASVSYNLLVDQTDYTYMAGVGVMLNPSYVRQELFAGVRVAY